MPTNALVDIVLSPLCLIFVELLKCLIELCFFFSLDLLFNLLFRVVSIGVICVPILCEEKQDHRKNYDDKQDELNNEVSYAFKDVADECKHG